MKRGLSLAIVGLWVVLQTTKGPLAEKLGLLASKAASSGVAGPGPTAGQGNPSGVSIWTPTPPPAGAPAGQYRVDQNGNVEENVGGQWVPFNIGTGQPAAPAALSF
jgi:hypothetical protein